MSAWVIGSLVGAVVVLAILFLCVCKARKRFMQIEEILKPIRTQSGMSVCNVWESQKSKDEFYEVNIQECNGYCYSPNTKTVSIEKDAFYSDSLFDVVAVSHEMGHAYAHQQGSKKMGLWYALSYFERAVCWSILPCFLIGFIMSWFGGVISNIGTLLLNISTLFTLMILVNRIATIPTEQEASKYGLAILADTQGVTENEFKMAKKMLNVALSTYVFAFYERLFYNVILTKRVIQKMVHKKKKHSQLDNCPAKCAKVDKELEETREIVNMIKEDNLLSQQEPSNLLADMKTLIEEQDDVIRRPPLDDEK